MQEGTEEGRAELRAEAREPRLTACAPLTTIVRSQRERQRYRGAEAASTACEALGEEVRVKKGPTKGTC